MRETGGVAGAIFHGSSAPETRGRKDGYAGSPPNRGNYGLDAWIAYLTGYRAGERAKAQWHAEQALAILRERVAVYDARGGAA